MIYGIDLGTSNCLMSKFDDTKKKDRLECLIDEYGNYNFPSVVHFKDESSVLIGQPAKEMLDELPDQTIELIKIRMGKQLYIQYNLRNEEKQIEPQSLTALFLNHFKKIHYKEGIKKVVLTVPAYFDDSQKNATKQAADFVDMEVVELIEEPSAAIMYFFYDLYVNKKMDKMDSYINKNYLMFDFGGGTLDLSLINIGLDSNNHIAPEVLLKDGSNKIGGNDIDFHLTKFLLEYLHHMHEDTFIDMALKVMNYYYKNLRFPEKTPKEVKAFILSLKKKAENLKVELSEKYEALIVFPNEEIYSGEKITRQDFEVEVLKKYFRKPVLDTLTRIRNKASHESIQIDEIVLVGGSAKIPFISSLVKEIFTDIPIRLMKDSELAVSKGAAIIGAIRSGKPVEPFGMNRCHNCVSHDLYIEQKGDNPIKIVEKGTKIPFTPISKSFKIKHALRNKIDIIIKEIYEQNSVHGINEDVLQENIVKKISFYNPFFYTGEEVDVILDTDELGLWSMKLIHTATKECVQFESEKHNILTGDYFDRAKALISNISIDN